MKELRFTWITLVGVVTLLLICLLELDLAALEKRANKLQR